jgi:hypothetical protein
LVLVPSGDQAFGVREHLRVGSTSGGDHNVRLGLVSGENRKVAGEWLEKRE